MSLIKVPINVPNIDLIMENYEFIKIFRAETKYGAYAEVTDNATRLELVEDTREYVYEDEDGDEYLWYKWKFYEDTDDLESPFSDPVQGYISELTYCMFEDIKRELRTNRNSSRVNFSERYKNLRKREDTPGTILLSAISVHPSYAGQERYTITFTSATEYNVTVEEDNAEFSRLVGSGKTTESFVSNDNSIKIYSASWSGTADIGSIIEFQTDSHMSINDGIKFTQDAEILVDMILEKNVRFTEEKKYDLRFERGEIPKGIRRATAKFAAFFIYSSIYNEQAQPGLPNNINDITLGLRREEDLSTWPKQASTFLRGFIDKYTSYFNYDTGDAAVTAPQWITSDTMFDATGVAYVGEGLKLPEMNEFTEMSNMSYDGLLDWDMMTTWVDSWEDNSSNV